MKKYLKVFVGSRNVLEDVSLVEFENIEMYLENERMSNVEFIEDELEGMYLWDWMRLDDRDVYYLGLGDEEMVYYVGINDVILEGLDLENVDEIDDEIIFRKVDSLEFI